MTYGKALELLRQGRRACIYRKSWKPLDCTACLIWESEAGEPTGRGRIHFSACGPWVYKTGSWSGTSEEREATDWAGTMPDASGRG